MSKIAEIWAQHQAENNILQHSQSKYKGQPLGENLAYKYSSKKDPYRGLL